VQRPGDQGQQDVESEGKILPLLVGALGTVKKEVDQNLQLLPGHLSAMQLQKITLMSTAHSIRKVRG